VAKAKRWVALLRGINLGSSRRIAMADLREVLGRLGYADVKTLLQSGNVVFSSTTGTAPAHAKRIAAGIEKDLGMDVKVLVFSAAELAAIVKANPFAAQRVDPKELHVTFLSGPTPRAKLAQIDRGSVAPDEFEPGKRAIYERRRGGVLASKLPDWQKVLGIDVTARNWNTVTKLAALP
jgi:uncharacterized protein (DUF1697 family)